MFRRDVLDSKFVSELIREISIQYDRLVEAEQQKRQSLLHQEAGDILSQSYQVLLKLDEELADEDDQYEDDRSHSFECDEAELSAKLCIIDAQVSVYTEDTTN